jgi:YHS domain-containing protein
MQVDEKTALYRSEHEGRTYYFCAPGCKREFDRDPHKYIARDAPPPHQHHT